MDKLIAALKTISGSMRRRFVGKRSPVVQAAAKLHWRLLKTVRGNSLVKFLLVLSHQRAGSTLLIHLLNTNPRILGYGETFDHYASPRDLQKLPFGITRTTRKIVWSQAFVVDKLLYDELLVDDALLRDENIYSIFLVREPQGALRSLVNAPRLDGWPQRPEANKDYVDHANVVKYYSSRLAMLGRYARIINSRSRSLFMTYEDILLRTNAVFGTLKSFLAVDGTFSEDYSVLRTTGVPGYGDVSQHIRRGCIDRNIVRPQNAVRPELIGEAGFAFDRCCRVLREYCSTVNAAETVCGNNE